MFSTKLTHLAHRASCAAALSAPSTSTAAASAHRSTQCVAARARRPHQRRHSSSKASCPPENRPSGGSSSSSKHELSNPENPEQRGTKRIPRTKRSRPAGAAKPEDQFAGLPAVPGTQHLHYGDLTVSSFFSLHRPLSLATTIPPPSSASDFDSIFETRPEQDPWENGNSAERRPEDVVYALANLFENLDTGASSPQEDGVRWQFLSESQSNQDDVKHLDGPPRLKSLDDVVASFRPYEAPPPPQPFSQEHKAVEKKKSTKSQKKSYATTIFITESTSANGERTFTATSSPVVRVPGPEEASTGEPRRTSLRERRLARSRQYFRARKLRLLEPQVSTPERKAPSAAQKYKMLLISVKRQRKLKMKKHKYKKLMKRTRNLRRRQDRA